MLKLSQRSLASSRLGLVRLQSCSGEVRFFRVLITDYRSPGTDGKQHRRFGEIAPSREVLLPFSERSWLLDRLDGEGAYCKLQGAVGGGL
jgi:hypothetical protein